MAPVSATITAHARRAHCAVCTQLPRARQQYPCASTAVSAAYRSCAQAGGQLGSSLAGARELSGGQQHLRLVHPQPAQRHWLVDGASRRLRRYTLESSALSPAPDAPQVPSCQRRPCRPPPRVDSAPPAPSTSAMRSGFIGNGPSYIQDVLTARMNPAGCHVGKGSRMTLPLTVRLD